MNKPIGTGQPNIRGVELRIELQICLFYNSIHLIQNTYGKINKETVFLNNEQHILLIAFRSFLLLYILNQDFYYGFVFKFYI